jgi:hypothetical protein
MDQSSCVHMYMQHYIHIFVLVLSYGIYIYMCVCVHVMLHICICKCVCVTYIYTHIRIHIQYLYILPLETPFSCDSFHCRWADRWKEEGIPLQRFRNLRGVFRGLRVFFPWNDELGTAQIMDFIDNLNHQSWRWNIGDMM